jgi:hypothetical protein
MPKTKQTLRKRVNAPLESAYPLYKKLNGRFPKGRYQLMGFSHSDTQSPEISIEKNTIDASLQVLIGNCNGYKSHVSRSIRQMCRRSIGRSSVSFLLSDADESMTGKSKMLLTQGKLSEQLLYPVRLSDFVRDDEVNKFTKIIVCCVMAILFHLRNRKNAQLSCQDRFNRFPSFYQSGHSASFRLQKLHATYGNHNEYAHELFDGVLLGKLGGSLLKSANLQYITTQTTQKKEKTNGMTLLEYAGKSVCSGCLRKCLPMLTYGNEGGHTDLVGTGLKARKY